MKYYHIEDVVPYGFERHLDNICDNNPTFENLRSTWNLNKKTCGQALKSVSHTYPHYSMHDENHARSIISAMEMVLGEERIARLSPTDTWMLLQLAYLHDFGMVVLFRQIETEWETREFQDYLKQQCESHDKDMKKAAEYLRDLKDDLADNSTKKSWPLLVRRYTTLLIADYYRSRHADMSGEYVDHMQELFNIDLSHNGLIQLRLIKQIGKISTLHTRDTDEVLKLDYQSNGFGADYIHPRFLAEMLRIGDLLDTDNGRFDSISELVSGEMPDSSKTHKLKHDAVIHLLVSPESVEYRANCGSPEVYRETRNLISWLKDELSFMAVHWSDIAPKNVGGTAPRLKKTELLLNGKPDLEGTSDLRLTISQEKAYSLIEGAGIYDDKYVFMRELIQNAEDASKLQLWRDLKAGRYDGLIKSTTRKKDSNGNDTDEFEEYDVTKLEEIQPYNIPEEIYDLYRIKVEIDKADDDYISVNVTDHGTGMNVEAFKQMSRTGESYYSDKNRRWEIEDMPRWLRPTAGFGIGLQSIFLVADKFEIDTMAEGCEPLHAVATSGKIGGIINLTESDKKMTRGTCVSVKIEALTSIVSKFGEENKAKRRLADGIDLLHHANWSTISGLNLVDRIESLAYNSLFGLYAILDKKKSTVTKPLVSYFSNTIIENDDRYVMVVDEKLKSSINCINKSIHKLASDNNCSFIFWDRVNYAFVNIRRDGFSETSVSFKGIKLKEKLEYRVYGVGIDVDFYGLNSKEYLNIDRESFNAKSKGKIIEYKKEYKIYYLDKIINLVENDLINEESLEGEENRQDNFAYWLWRTSNDRQRQRIWKEEKYTSLLRSISNKVCVLSRCNENRTFEKTEETVENIIRNLTSYGYISL